ncbi:CpaF family protein [Actinospica robiniae]|uniref:CpaF family protein n=1 Tax=Actinospica robiniae TaxID=304901 RepID=UPI00041890F5|nr:ATPase, T2SS/T4P/T4SS family [Actinospica robiniae]
MDNVLVSPTAIPEPDGALAYRLPSALEEDLAQQLSTHIISIIAAQARESGVILPSQRRAEVVESLLSEELDSFAAACLRTGSAGLSPGGQQRVASRVRADVLGFGPLQHLLDDPDIETINAQGCDRVFTIRANGVRQRELALAADDDAFVELIRSLANSGGQERRFDKAVAQLNAQLPDGSRLFASIGVCKRPVLSIRRHRLADTTLKELVAKGLSGEELAAFLAALVGARFNLLISGGTGAGKTTLLRALAAELPATERLVIIEDTYELGLDELEHRHADVVSFQAREANTEGEGRVTQAELVRCALRLSPDRVLVGEVRGDELVPMCNAMNLGLDGSMTTVHASSSGQVSQRLINIGLQAPERLSPEATVALVASAVDFIIQLDRADDGVRVIGSIREVCGSEGAQLTTNEVYRPGPNGRARYATRCEQRTLNRLEAAGYDLATWRKVTV